MDKKGRTRVSLTCRYCRPGRGVDSAVRLRHGLGGASAYLGLAGALSRMGRPERALALYTGRPQNSTAKAPRRAPGRPGCWPPSGSRTGRSPVHLAIEIVLPRRPAARAWPRAFPSLPPPPLSGICGTCGAGAGTCSRTALRRGVQPRPERFGGAGIPPAGCCTRPNRPCQQDPAPMRMCLHMARPQPP